MYKSFNNVLPELYVAVILPNASIISFNVVVILDILPILLINVLLL